MDEDHKLLNEAIEKNRSLLIEIKDNIVEEINLLKLKQQKLRFSIYGLAVGIMILAGKPELISKLF